MRPTQGERFYRPEKKDLFPLTLSRRRPLRRRIEGCPLRGKAFVDRVANSRRYRITPDAIRTLAALFILREHVIEPVIAGAGKPRVGRPPKLIHPIDRHYEALRREMWRTFETLNLAA